MAVGTGMMVDIVANGGITALESVILLLFAATFGWIAISFWNAAIGFIIQALGRHPLTLGRLVGGRRGEDAGRPASPLPRDARTALVMPAFNEDPHRLVAGLTTMLRSLAATGRARHFDLHLLSDTTDPALARAEEEAWNGFVARMAPHLPRATGLFYRRRPRNTGRKAGNIAEFCRRRGGDYAFMVILDADSVMSGPTLVSLVRAMVQNPRAGLIQTVPLPAAQETLFGRLVRFGGQLYGPMLATGQSFWQGDAANYWGHNAILRVAPFTEHCTLPILSGRPPWGGEILSHDFVEAALLRRAGWQVFLLPDLDGSTEDVPGNIPDFARRDRRWAQGSLQHLRLLGMPGLHPLSRVHFLMGAMGYISSLLWLLMLLAGTAYVGIPQLAAPLVAPGAFPTAGPWPGAAHLLPLLAVTGVLLFLPKALALLLVLARPGARALFGGAPRLLAGALVEIVFAVLVAPLMMMIHARAVLEIIAGRGVRWDPQDRSGRTLPLSDAFRHTAWITAVGVTWSGVTLLVSPPFYLWMTPIFTGLLLAAPITAWTSRRDVRAARGRLFSVETSELESPPGWHPPQVLPGDPPRRPGVTRDAGITRLRPPA
jgi:membrane glycosyltransferase